MKRIFNEITDFGRQLLHFGNNCSGLARHTGVSALLFFISFPFIPVQAQSQLTENATAIFDPMFRTLTVTLDDNLMADPVMILGADNKLTFSFDEIAPDRSYLRCRLLHCNADWQPSRLVESEYVDGFNEAQIEDFGYSSNTFIRYVNYKFTIGEEGLLPLVSGNYLWQVYDESDPEKILLQARFRVSEGNASIIGEASSRTDNGFNTEYQQVNLAVSAPREVVPNPYSDIVLELTQNSRPDMTRMIEHPFRVEGNNIIYEHQPQMIFPAVNEYRRFETVRNDYPGMGVDSTRYVEPMYNAWLTPAETRADKGYIFDSTQHGRFKIDEYNSTDADLGADYILTHFTLDFPEVMDGDIYVEGDLTLRGYTEANRMKYNRNEGVYELAIPLKQGSYNYQYVIKKRNPDSQDSISQPSMGGNIGKTPANASIIEGDKYETINEYNAYIWLRLPGARADRLLGARTIVIAE